MTFFRLIDIFVDQVPKATYQGINGTNRIVIHNVYEGKTLNLAFNGMVFSEPISKNPVFGKPMALFIKHAAKIQDRAIS